jgi:hypothetical protein
VAVFTGAVVVTLMIAGRAAHRHPAVRSVLLATASGIAFGMSSVFTKTVTVDWDNGAVSATDIPFLGVIAVFAVAGLMLSQASYRGAGLAAPLAVLTVVNPVVAAAVGITMFGETFRYGTTGTLLALSAGVVAAGGLILLTTERLEKTAPADTTTAPLAPSPIEELLDALPGQPVDVSANVGVRAADITADAQGTEILVPAPAAIPAGEGYETLEPAGSAEPPSYFGPFHAGLYVMMPVHDRHRTRVKS